MKLVREPISHMESLEYIFQCTIAMEADDFTLVSQKNKSRLNMKTSTRCSIQTTNTKPRNHQHVVQYNMKIDGFYTPHEDPIRNRHSKLHQRMVEVHLPKFIVEEKRKMTRR